MSDSEGVIRSPRDGLPKIFGGLNGPRGAYYAPRAGLLAAHEHTDNTGRCGRQDTASTSPAEGRGVLATLTATVVKRQQSPAHQ